MTKASLKRPSARPRAARRRPRFGRVSEGFRALVLDNLTDLGDVVPRPMFGCVGLYCRGIFFGIIAADVLYLKADEETRSDYERAGATPFRPYADRAGTMQYYAVPVEVLESEPELIVWARKAVAAAERAGAAPKRRPPRKRKSRSSAT